MAVTAKADWIDRALAGVGVDALSAARALVAVTPKVPTFYPPIRDALALAETPVGVEPMMVEPTEAEWVRNQALVRDAIVTQLAGHEPTEEAVEADYVSALRQHLAGAIEWGGKDEVAALVMVNGIPTTLRITGTEAAVRQALPDAETVAAWKAAGVTEFPMQLSPGHGTMRRITWVPIDQVPTVLQLERTWRGAHA